MDELGDEVKRQSVERSGNRYIGTNIRIFIGYQV